MSLGCGVMLYLIAVVSLALRRRLGGAHSPD